MKEIRRKEEDNREDNKEQNLATISDFLEAIKQKELSKAVNRRKTQLSGHLLGRNYNPYCSYLTMNKEERRDFRQKDRVLELEREQVGLSKK